MEMQQIRYFLVLCEERSFTRAAKRCGISQPSLTNAIIGLERELGGVLFQRKPLIALTARAADAELGMCIELIVATPEPTRNLAPCSRRSRRLACN